MPSSKLSEMTLEELWALFPIFLTEPQPCWKTWYSEEAAFLQTILSPIDRISHIGSTSLGTIWAKPIIDILVEAPACADFGQIKTQLEDNGYICMSQSPERASFNKGYTEQGFAERVYHLHLRRSGDNAELYFRDYLMEHPDAAKEYEALKLSLWHEYEHNRDGYTAAKGDFVQKYTQEARNLYKQRY